MDVLDSVIRDSGIRSATEHKPCRKRQRLDHLTSEEKLLRRKMKNRAAAQSARDRKKAHMDELEIEVDQLRLDAQALAEENERLRDTVEEQAKQIEELQERLASVVKTEPVEPQLNGVDDIILDEMTVAEDSLEHAEGPGVDGPVSHSDVASPISSVHDIGVDAEDIDDPEERQLSLFDDKELVALLLNQPAGDEPAPSSPPIIEVDASPLENLDHVYHKQLQPATTTPASAGVTEAVTVTQQLLVPLDIPSDSRPPSSMSTCPRSPFSSSSSSGYDSDYRDSDTLTWEENISDLFPDLEQLVSADCL